MSERPEDTAAYDAATVAMLRNLSRVGKQREVLKELSPREQQKVFDAEARHYRRTRGK